MKIEIEIPKEFEKDFKHDRFEECLTRLNADAHMTAGNYEKETAIMLIKALKNSKPAYDVDEVAEQLKQKMKRARDKERENTSEYFEGEADGFEFAIEIVKGGGIDAD